MKSFTIAMMVAVSIGVVFGAQNPATGTQSGTRTDAATSANQGRGTGTVTLVGCLQRGNAGQSTTGGAGAAATPADAFVLASARRTEPEGAPGTSRTSTSGTTAPDGSGQVVMDYVLEGTAADLAPHVGHRIEVTGMLAGGRGRGGRGGRAAGDTSATGTGAGAGAATTGGATGTGTAGATGRGGLLRFTVASVRMISADCSATR